MARVLDFNQVAAIERLANEGRNAKSIAEELALSLSSVRGVLNSRTYRRPAQVRGQGVKMTAETRRLSDDVVADIRRRHEEGETKASIARSTGFDWVTIHHVVSDLSWQHTDRVISDRTLSAEEVLRLRDRAAAGATVAQLAREFGRTPVQIGKIIRGRVAKKAGGPLRSTANPYAPKLGISGAVLVQALHLLNVTKEQIARELDVHPSSVRGALRRAGKRTPLVTRVADAAPHLTPAHRMILKRYLRRAEVETD